LKFVDSYEVVQAPAVGTTC